MYAYFGQLMFVHAYSSFSAFYDRRKKRKIEFLKGYYYFIVSPLYKENSVLKKNYLEKKKNVSSVFTKFSFKLKNGLNTVLRWINSER